MQHLHIYIISLEEKKIEHGMLEPFATSSTDCSLDGFTSSHDFTTTMMHAYEIIVSLYGPIIFILDSLATNFCYILILCFLFFVALFTNIKAIMV
jgi:hypothetical protein